MENLMLYFALVLFVLAVFVCVYDLLTGRVMRKWLLKNLPKAMKLTLLAEGIKIKEDDLNKLENFISDGILTQGEKDEFLSIISSYLSQDEYVERKDEILSIIDSTIALISNKKLDDTTINNLKTIAVSFLNLMFKRLK